MARRRIRSRIVGVAASLGAVGGALAVGQGGGAMPDAPVSARYAPRTPSPLDAALHRPASDSILSAFDPESHLARLASLYAPSPGSENESASLLSLRGGVGAWGGPRAIGGTLTD